MSDINNMDETQKAASSGIHTSAQDAALTEQPAQTAQGDTSFAQSTIAASTADESVEAASSGESIGSVDSVESGVSPSSEATAASAAPNVTSVATVPSNAPSSTEQSAPRMGTPHDAVPQSAPSPKAEEAAFLPQSANAPYTSSVNLTKTAPQSGTQSNKTKEQPNAQKSKKTGKIAFMVIVVTALLCGVYTTLNLSFGKKSSPSFDFTGGFFGKSSDSQSLIGTFTDDYIAEIAIEGTIEELNNTYDQQWLLDTINELMSDDKNRGLFLLIDSPGGAVYQADDLYLKLKEYRQSGKPIFAYCASMAASGGYYLACSAEKILSNRNALVGSIGVLYGPSIDLTELMQKYGIKMTTFTSGKNKNMLNIDSPVTEEQAAIMQSVVDEAYEQFTGIVAESRAMPIETVYALADGRIYTAKQALENGLIDDICTYNDAKDRMIAELYGKDYCIDFQLIEKEKKKTFYDYLTDTYMRFSGKDTFIEETLLQKIMHFPKGLAYYYPL